MSQIAACAYVRVSTSQQAQHDLSIPDQLNQIKRFADSNGLHIVAEFVEAGASARSDQRPRFQEMMARALSKPPEFRVIAVYAMSRLFRDEMYYEMYRRKLERNGVRIVSITQDFGTGPGAELTRRIMALTDEINSVENAKHVRRTMLENARQGFWNGSKAPLGYQTVVADVRGHKLKKRLEIDPEGAEVVRLIYRLYLEGDGVQGPMGTKNVVKHLNERGFRTPPGNRMNVNFVNRILRDEVYAGCAWYNRIDSRNGTLRPRDEWIAVPVPAIIDKDYFQRVQVQLCQRSPKITAPRLVNSNVLLTGLARCGGCGSSMFLQYAKSGRYAYYRCSGKVRQGFCEAGTSHGISTPLLDQAVLDRVLEDVLSPNRVQAIVAEVAAKRAAGIDQVHTSVGQLKAEREKAQRRIANLLRHLADGVVQSTDAFQSTMADIEADIARLSTLIEAQERLLERRLQPISLEQATALSDRLREKLTTGAASLKKRILRNFVSAVVVTPTEIVIKGAKSDLAELVTATH